MEAVYWLLAFLAVVCAMMAHTLFCLEKDLKTLKYELQKNRFEINDTKERLGIGFMLPDLDDD